jgi:hypothetical protein
MRNRELRTHEAAIDPTATGLSWWQCYDTIQPGMSGLAQRLSWDRTNLRWKVAAAAERRTIYDRPGGPGAANNLLVGCLHLPSSRRLTIVHSRTWYWARPTSTITAGTTTGALTLYLKTSTANWIATSYTITAGADVQMTGVDTIVVDARCTVEWEAFAPLPTVAPFGQWIIRTASCGAMSW